MYARVLEVLWQCEYGHQASGLAICLLTNVATALVGNFSEPIDRTHVVPALACFVPPRERTSVRNHDSKKKVLSKLGNWIAAMQFPPWNAIKNVLDILPRGHDWRPQQAVIVYDP